MDDATGCAHQHAVQDGRCKTCGLLALAVDPSIATTLHQMFVPFLPDTRIHVITTRSAAASDDALLDHMHYLASPTYQAAR